MDFELKLTPYFQRVYRKIQISILRICALFAAPAAILGLHLLEEGIGRYISALFVVIMLGALVTILVAVFISIFDG